MIGITGTAGKSTCKTLLNELLEVNHTVNSTRGNHNTRTECLLRLLMRLTTLII